MGKRARGWIRRQPAAAGCTWFKSSNTPLKQNPHPDAAAG